MIVEELVARIGLDFTGAANAARAVRAVDGIKGAFIGVGGIFTALGASLAANVLSVEDTIGKFQDFGDAVGASVQGLQALTYAAELNGGGFEDVSSAMRTLVDTAGNAASGNETAAASFAALGVSIRDAGGEVKTADQLMAEVADGISKVNDPTKRLSLSTNLLGKSAVKLLPALAGGAESLARMREEAEKVGFVLDKNTIARFGALGDGIDRLKTRFVGMRNLLAKAFLPTIEAAVKSLTSFLDRNGKGIIGIFERIGNVVGGTLSIVARAIGFVVDGFMSFADFSPILAALTAGAFLFAAAWFAPAIAIGLLAVVLGILAEDFNAFLEGKPSALGDLIGKFETLRDVIKSISDVFSGNLGTLIYDALNPGDTLRARAKRTFGQQTIDSADGAIAAQRSTGVTDNAYNATGVTATMPFGLPLPAGTNTTNNSPTTNNVQITVNGSGDPSATAQAVLAAQMRASTKRK